MDKFVEYAKNKNVPYGHIRGNNIDKVETQLRDQYATMPQNGTPVG